MPLKSLDKVLLDELKDLYSAENQILKALPKMAKAASSPLLKEAFTSHIEQTRGQVARLDRIARLMGEKSFKGKKCKAMEGLLEEGTELIEEGGDPAVLDAAMIGAAQKVEHYEIAGYGTARTHARHLGHEQVARLLQETLDEEGQTDKNLTKIAQRKINLDAKAEGDDGGRKGGAKGAAKGGAKKSAAKGGAQKSAAKGGASKGAAKGGVKKGATKSAARSGAAKSGGAKSGAKSGARGTSGGSTSGMSRGGRAGAGSVAGESRTSAREGASRIARSAAATRTSMPGPGVTSRSLPAGTKRGGGATKTAGGRATASRSTSPAGRAKEAPAGRASAARSTRTGGEAKAAPQARTTAAPATTAPATTAPAISSPTVSPSTPAGGSAAPTSGVTPSSRTAPGGDVGQGRFGGGGGGGDASQAEIERAGLGPEDIEHTIEEIRSGEIAGGFSGADDFVEGESFEGADEGGNAGDAYDASTGG
ncbi:MAG TPA: DUF892 family protein [Candidatus Kapabacteria bacterium]|nr:DUF892 family protein [Candidatus Kapabacteria bacterium]